ncbi:MAG: hypothetical protein RTU30_04515 [Candidatus Thorarchaeota archaeon]
MGYMIEDLEPSGVEKYESAKECLLPNEDILFVCQILNGFLVLSARRVVFLLQDNQRNYRIERVIPYDCVLGFSQMNADRFRATGITLDHNGCYELLVERPEPEYMTKEFDIKAPRPEKGENKSDVIAHFQTTMSLVSDVLDITKSSFKEPPPYLDYSYMKKLPTSLTNNAILDLNIVLQDMPIHDELYHEAAKFLGSETFLLEESLRDGLQRKNGVLFAAGILGYIWIQGEKEGRYMANVLVDKVEWDNIRCFAHRWQTEDNIIEATYSLQKDTTELSVSYIWRPTANQDTPQWLSQELNGPWLLADVMYKYSGKPMPASWINEKQSEIREMYKQRYYY